MNTGINGYFEKCFLERMNKDGRTIQERVKTRKEKEFEYELFVYPNEEISNDTLSRVFKKNNN